jgi:glycosyltransferase involved in cell wall biosynthesis
MKLAAHVARSKVRVWILEGRFNEHEMSGIYAASDAYVSASIGEGWNLPAHEASACLKPVIVPRNSVHPEIFGEDAFVFDVDGVGRLPEVEPVSPWYVGMEFSILQTKATKNLAAAMLTVNGDGHKVRSKVHLLNDRLSSLTWDATASNVTRRLIEVQP